MVRLIEPTLRKTACKIRLSNIAVQTWLKIACSLKLLKRALEQALNFNNTLRPTPNSCSQFKTNFFYFEVIIIK